MGRLGQGKRRPNFASPYRRRVGVKKGLLGRKRKVQEELGGAMSETRDLLELLKQLSRRCLKKGRKVNEKEKDLGNRGKSSMAIGFESLPRKTRPPGGYAKGLRLESAEKGALARRRGTRKRADCSDGFK